MVVAASCGGSDEAIPDGPGGTPDAPRIDAPPACPAPTGPGVEHQGAIAADETWTAADSPHIVTFDQNRYDLQSVGEFVLAKSGDLEVHVRQAAFAGSRTVSRSNASTRVSSRPRAYAM